MILMKAMVVHSMVAVLCLLLAGTPVFGWAHANYYGGGGTYHGASGTTRTNAWGGSAYHSYGSNSTSFSGRYGGSGTHTYGQGTSYTTAAGTSVNHSYGSGQTTANTAYGGSATHYAGGGYTATSASGATVAGNDHYYGGAYGAYSHPPTGYYPAYPAYHPPVVVASYPSCYNCGGWSAAGAAAVGMTAGMVTGAAIASSANSASNANAYAAGVAAGSANTAATTNAYNAGVAAGVSMSGQTPGYTVGEIVAVLPAGCVTPTVNGKAYYLCGNTWFSAAYGANGVYYRVVPTP
jgi:hypothetical protein